jgi:hypothetical protein
MQCLLLVHSEDDVTFRHVKGVMVERDADKVVRQVSKAARVKASAGGSRKSAVIT